MAKVQASTIVKRADQEVGYHEKKSNKDLDSKTANSGSNNFTKYARDVWNLARNILNGNKQGVEWCAVFCIWLFVICFGASVAQAVLYLPNKSCAAGADYFMKYFKAKNKFYKTPKVGDMIFFSSGTKAKHVGLVVEVTSTQVKTIEGNSSNMVRRKSYKLSDKTILGYGRPNYDAEPEPTPTPTPTSDFKVGDKVKLVEGATWYNGGKIPAWVFKEVLYVRRINDNGSIAVSIYSTGAITGTVDPKYLVHYEEPFKAKVINVKSYLNVRSGPGTNYPSIGRVYDGNILTISKEDSRWWYSPDVNGWMSMDYLKKV